MRRCDWLRETPDDCTRHSVARWLPGWTAAWFGLRQKRSMSMMMVRRREEGPRRPTAGARVTKLRLKPPSKTEPRRSERIFVTRRPFGPQLRQLLKPKLVSIAQTSGLEDV